VFWTIRDKSGLADPDLSCRIVRESPVALVRVAGTLTVHTAPAVRTALLGCLSSQPELIVVDVSTMDTEDDVALSVLPSMARHAAAWPGASLVLGAPGPHLSKALDRMAVPRSVPIFPTVEQALASRATRVPRKRSSQVLKPIPRSLLKARSLVKRACTGWNVCTVTDRAQIVTTELVANALRHAGTRMELTVALRQRCLHLSVRDGNRSAPRLREAGCESDDAVESENAAGGRGLRIVEALAAGWGSTPTENGKVVWATLRLSPTARR
jgi:anti-anti-sigma regulatory factor